MDFFHKDMKMAYQPKMELEVSSTHTSVHSNKYQLYTQLSRPLLVKSPVQKRCI